MAAKQLKLCGINNIKTIKHILNHPNPANFLGFIFYQKSSRYINLDQAKAFNELNFNKSKKIAVTVNAKFKEIEQIVKNLNPDLIQLHGNENIEYCSKIKQEFNLKIIKAIQVENITDIKQAEKYHPCTEYILFDSKTTEYGGSGKGFNHELLRDYNNKNKIFISGGLNINNIEKIINNFNLFDICSGIELQKGVKDNKKITEILDYFNKINAKQ